jgi:hypothetical protein
MQCAVACVVKDSEDNRYVFEIKAHQGLKLVQKLAKERI